MKLFIFSLLLPLLSLKLQLKNLSAMEANIVRPFVTRALETFYKLGSSDMIQESDHAPNRQQQVINRGPRVSYISMLYVV